MNEHIVKAEHALGFAADDLRAALTGSGAVDAILLLSMIGDVERLRSRVNEYLGALEADGRRACPTTPLS